MSTRAKLIKAWLRMLDLAEELSNVGLACKRAGPRTPNQPAIASHVKRISFS